MLNRVILIGRLTRDPELKYLPNNGTAVTTFTIAINRKFNREETDFIPCVVWRKPAENCANFLKKGSLCAIEGRLQVRSYDTQEGQKRWVTEVIADDVRFLDPKGKGKPTESDSWDELGREVSIDDDEPNF